MIPSVSISSLGGVLANAVTDATEAVLEGSMRLVEELPIPEPVGVGQNQALRFLDLSSNQLRVPPDVSRNQALQKLYLSNNRLQVSPDVSRNQALQILDLSNTQLQVPPDVSRNQALQKLYLSNNRLQVSPDVSRNQALQTLDLWGNQLRVAPDVSRNQVLQTLDLSNNQLQVPPDVSRNQALQKLYLSNNRLQVSPDVSQNQALQTLSFSNNRLQVSPDVSQNQALQTLSFSNNQLRVAPDVSRNQALQTLDLSNNRLQVSPDVSRNQALKILNLSNNQLRVPLDVSQNQDLFSLQLSNNQLRVSPDVSRNQALQTLHLSDNQLTELHDSILSLPNTCRVYAENNRFSAEYIVAFQARLAAHRALHPDQGPTVYMSIHDAPIAPLEPQTLEQNLLGWATEFTGAFPRDTNQELWDARSEITADNCNRVFASLLRLDEGQRNALNNFLTRLRATADYNDRDSQDNLIARSNVVLRVDKMLQRACQDEKFLKEMGHIMHGALASCKDRIALGFNDIEIACKMCEAQGDPESFREMCIQKERYEALIKHAEDVIRANQFGEEVETVLFYLLHLDKVPEEEKRLYREGSLTLPITGTRMAYAGCSGVSLEMLKEARAKISAISDEKLLKLSKPWKERFLQDQIEKITNHYGDLLEKADLYYNTLEESERSEFLAKNEGFAGVLTSSPDIKDYGTACVVISGLRDAAIQQLPSRLTRPNEGPASAAAATSP